MGQGSAERSAKRMSETSCSRSRRLKLVATPRPLLLTRLVARAKSWLMASGSGNGKADAGCRGMSTAAGSGNGMQTNVNLNPEEKNVLPRRGLEEKNGLPRRGSE